MVDAVLFDLDDTLYDRIPCVERSVADQFARYCGEFPGVTFDIYRDCFSGFDYPRGFVAQFEAYEGLLRAFSITTLTPDDLINDFRDRLIKHLPQYEEGRALLTALSQRGIKLGVITNGPSDIQRRKIEALNLEARLDTILISGEEGVRKPDIQIFHRAASRLGVAPDACLFVGDNPHADIYGAKATGVRIPLWAPVFSTT